MSEYKPEILFLKQEDVIAAGLLDMKMILEVTEKTFKMIGEGQVINPTKVFMGMPDDENWTSYCMSMPSYLGGDINIAGFKWAAESVFNATQPGMPYGVDVVTLSDPKTVYPKAIMEAVPSVETIYLCDLDITKAEGIAKEYEGKYNVVPCGSTEEAAKKADLIVTETTARKPFLKAEWVKPNATVIQMAMHEIEEEILLKADKKGCDNWSQLTHLPGTLMNKLNAAGKISEDMFASLPQLAAGQKPGRESEDELCVCCTAGVGAVDIAVAHKIYTEALAKGIGQKLMLWDNPLWV